MSEPWLENLKVGDEVAVRGYSHGDRDYLAIVERATPGHLFVEGRKFRRRNGRIAGGDVGSPEIVEPTPHIRWSIDNAAYLAVCDRIKAIRADALPPETWRVILDLLTPR